MARQNRVTPRGKFVTSNSRTCMFMGNRGCLHNSSQQIIRTTKINGWVTCQLKFNGIKRELMSPGQYTELFFLDEATALSAGHRPCATCQNKRYKEFKRKWYQAQGLTEGDSKSMDLQLHAERMDSQKKKITFAAAIDSLPDGTFIEQEQLCYLVWGSKLLQWSDAGYVSFIPRPPSGMALVLTPKSIVDVLRQGYLNKDDLHPTAQSFL